MTKRMIVIFITLLCLLISIPLFAQSFYDIEKYWPQWRGPYGTGVSLTGNPPLTWSESKNIKWKIKIPGTGHSTPIVWGDKLFVSTAIEMDKEAPAQERDSGRQQNFGGMMPANKTTKVHKFVVLAINRNDGKVLWQKTVKEEVPQEGTHEFGSWASNSAVTDGNNIYAYFGSRGLFCLDLDGNVKWERDFGQMKKHMEFGEGSSPALYKDKVIVTWDHTGESFIIAVDKQTGKDVWRVARDEETSWATPFVVEHEGVPQVITSATNLIRSYNLNTGEIIWECKGMTSNPIPTPVIEDNIIYFTSGFRGSALLAIDLSKAKGNITGSDAILWSYNQDTPYAPSPLLMNGKIYFLRVNTGSISCLDAKDGKVYYSNERLDGMGNVFTSPLGVKDRIYLSGRTGITYVLKQGSQFEILAKNQLEDGFHASPVVIDNELYLRSFKYLYCISEN